MGAKASTVAQSAGGNGQSSAGANETGLQGFAILRSLPPGVSMLQHQHQQGNQSQTSRVSGDSRQRARSLSSVPDLSGEQSSLASSVGVGVGQALGLPQLDSDDADEDSGRVYAAHSLPSHIWSLNGEFIGLEPVYYGIQTNLIRVFLYTYTNKHIMYVCVCTHDKVTMNVQSTCSNVTRLCWHLYVQRLCEN